MSKQLVQVGTQRITRNEQVFIHCLLDGRLKAFMRPTDAYMRAYGVTDRTKASKYVNKLMKRERIRMAIKDQLQAFGADKLIVDGFKRILKKPGSKQFLQCCDMIFKLGGDYAPDKVMQMNMTPAELQTDLEELKKLMGGAVPLLASEARENVDGEIKDLLDGVIPEIK